MPYYEIIIVNDGSTEERTLAVFRNLVNSSRKILHQSNAGLGNARNEGCRQASGEFLLFLDSDNKIDPVYIDKGVDILRNNKRIGVVYGNPVIFGDNSRVGFISGPFDIRKLIAFNYIDACAIIQKAAWIDVDGFNEDRKIMGIADWDFWLKLYKAGWLFEFINKPLYHYRIRKGSMASVEADSSLAKLKLYEMHADLISKQYFALYKQFELRQKDLNWSPRYILKRLFRK